MAARGESMEPLEMAIRMEIEGKEFYQNAAKMTVDNLGRELFLRLAKEEDFHAAKAREIADFLRRGETPLAIEESLDRGKRLKSILDRAMADVDSHPPAASELEAIEHALELEEASRKFYEEQSGTARTDFEKRFFTAVGWEERGHYLSLVDYREYLVHPSGWFAKHEHSSLDGG